MSEIIKIDFPPEQEGMTWEKREPHKIIKKEKEEVKKSTETIIKKEEIKKEKEPKKVQKDPFADYALTMNFVTKKLKESKNVKYSYDAKNYIKQLTLLKKEILNHIRKYPNKKRTKEYLNKIDSRIKALDKLVIKPITVPDNSQTNIPKSPKGLEIEEKLNIIKKEIRKNNLDKTLCNSLLEKLQEIKDDIEEDSSVFIESDNIKAKLFQIKYNQDKLIKILGDDYKPKEEIKKDDGPQKNTT